MSVHFRLLLVTGILLVGLFSISALFWEHELKYTQPTPQPANYNPIPMGATVDLAAWGAAESGVRHFHFYNPECPCSRFNLKHFRTLVRSFQDQVDFYVVIPPSEKGNSEYLADVRSRFDPAVEVIIDDEKQLAEVLGVYATPQAVIVSDSGTIAFRGNYNRTRYCTNPQTDFARMALEATLTGEPVPDFGPLASVAYGCQIPDSQFPKPEPFVDLYGSSN